MIRIKLLYSVAHQQEDEGGHFSTSSETCFKLESTRHVGLHRPTCIFIWFSSYRQFSFNDWLLSDSLKLTAEPPKPLITWFALQLPHLLYKVLHLFNDSYKKKVIKIGHFCAFIYDWHDGNSGFHYCHKGRATFVQLQGFGRKVLCPWLCPKSWLSPLQNK